jgi:hypothetical protein
MYPFDQNSQHVYEQYAYAHDTGDYSRVDPNVAMGILQQFLQSAPPEMVQGLFQQYFQQMPPDLRAQLAQQMPSLYGINPNNPLQMAQGFQSMSQQQPGWLDQIFSQGGPFGNPLFKAVAVGVAALAAKHLLSSHHGEGLGNLLGGVLGGGQYYGDREGGWDSYNRRRGGLRDIVGGLFGGRQHERHREDDDDDRGYRRQRHHDDDDDD